MKFLVDMPLSPALADWLEGAGHDAVHASMIGLSRAEDEQIVGLCRAEGRIVVTADLDYPRILAVSNLDRPGIILFRGADWNQKDIETKLEHVFATLTPDQLDSCILVIEKTRIRRRALPLQ